MLKHHLFPDVVAAMCVEVAEVVRRFLPARLTRWREKRDHRREQLRLVAKLQHEHRVRVNLGCKIQIIKMTKRILKIFFFLINAIMY